MEAAVSGSAVSFTGGFPLARTSGSGPDSYVVEQCVGERFARGDGREAMCLGGLGSQLDGTDRCEG